MSVDRGAVAPSTDRAANRKVENPANSLRRGGSDTRQVVRCRPGVEPALWRIVKAAGGRGCGRWGAWGGGCLGLWCPGRGAWGRGCARPRACGCGSCRGARAAPASVESWERDPWAACRRGPRGRTLLGLRWFRADPRHHTAHDHSHQARLSRGVPAPRFCCRSWRLGDGRTVSGASPYGRGVRSGAMGLQRCGTRGASIGRLPPPSGREVGPARRPLVRPAVWRRLVGGGMGDFGRALRRVGEVSRTGLAPAPGVPNGEHGRR